MEISKELRIEFNKRFASGEQYIEIYRPDTEYIEKGEPVELAIREIDGDYFWQQRAVYNKILPIVEHFETKYLIEYPKLSDNSKQKWEDLIYGENGLVERLIPLQREYNNIRNRENEFIDKLSLGVTFIEDGSVDVDNLAEEGLEPGKIIIYRCGSQAPTIVQPDTKPYAVYSDKLARIGKEIADISIGFQNNVLERVVNCK